MKSLLMKVCLVFAMTASTFIASDMYACEGTWYVCESDRESVEQNVANNCEDDSELELEWMDC